MRNLIKSVLREQIRTIQRLNTIEFIERAKNVHSDKYDYSETEYTNIKSPVKIICPKPGHGEFLQRAEHHLNGSGCPICAGKGRQGKRTTDEVISLAKKVHGDEYDYSETEYVNIKTPIKIICTKPNHGPFYQSADNHINGKQGCPICGGSKKFTSEDFIQESQTIHGDKYDYSLVNYTNAKTPIKIICPKENHGIFIQRPDHHLNGAGCPICRESRGENNLAKIFTSHKIKFERQKTFKNCFGPPNKKNFCRKLLFDFYLPDFNAVVEYDGKQHYEPILFYGGENSFELLQLRDQIKNQYCVDNGIKMIRIPYSMKKEEIPTYIKNKLGIK